ncbi:MAG: type II secretion system protein [Verrucomicrobiota bacterium]
MKTMHNPKSKTTCRGFSLIEMLAAITIMAVLGAIAVPGINSAVRKAQIMGAASNARQIAMGLRNYATDNEGLFPVADMDGNEFTSSNEVFRELLPDYLDSERIFSVGRSAWGSRADNRFDEESDRVEAGENHFAYISGLTTTSRTDWPLVVDGTDGNGTYNRERGTKGGCWDGTSAVVVSVGGSARTIRLRGDSDSRYIPREGYPEENALDVGDYMGDSAALLEPEEG